MAKKILTPLTGNVATNNVQSQPDQPTISASALKQVFDQLGIDIVAFLDSTTIAELQSETVNDSGAHAIGLNTPSSSEDNVGDQIETILQAGSGTIPPDGTITNAKLATDVKVGSLAALNTTVKTDVVSAVNEVDTNVDTNTTNITTNTNGVNQALNPIAPDSVVSQLINVTVPDTNQKKFTLDIQTTVTGGPITINKNAEGALNLKNPDGTDVEELSQDTRFFDIIDDSTVFTLAPKGGGDKLDLTSDGYGETTTTNSNSTVHSVVGSGWIFSVSNSSATGDTTLIVDGSYIPFHGQELINASYEGDFTLSNLIRFESGFELKEGIGTAAIAYALDDGSGLLKNSTPKYYSGEPSGGTTLRKTVNGSGYVTGISRLGTGTANKIVCDGVTVMDKDMNDISSGFYCMWRFNSTLEIYTESVFRTTVNYLLD